MVHARWMWTIAECISRAQVSLLRSTGLISPGTLKTRVRSSCSKAQGYSVLFPRGSYLRSRLRHCGTTLLVTSAAQFEQDPEQIHFPENHSGARAQEKNDNLYNLISAAPDGGGIA